jgi:sialate O-acetylesterase
MAVVFPLVALFAVPQALADVKLPNVISSQMVLQRDRPLPIWGWADPGEEVTVNLDDATFTAKADAQGTWKVVLPAVKADGKAHNMTINGKNKIKLDDILIGEVWMSAGQSNMEFPLTNSIGGKEAVVAADCPQIRLLHEERVMPPQPTKDIVVAGSVNTRAARSGSPLSTSAAG